ncbi:LOW QUALITY PROTEIN: hypothetical protein U9M48_042050 [Paspalum notatum var. saurae]|uniref:Uncharacterized protein n=1 Tax=Paspalum notatum var. saurae TaxID=547442 RepID=A0AAQ3XE32_PASNO
MNHSTTVAKCTCIGNITLLMKIHLPNNQLQGCDTLTFAPRTLWQDSRDPMIIFQAIDLVTSNSLSGKFLQGMLGTLPKLSVLTLSGNYVTNNLTARAHTSTAA